MDNFEIYNFHRRKSAENTLLSLIDRSLTECSDDKVTAIEQNAFKSCSSLASVSFPNAQRVGNYAFALCSALTDVNFPSVSYIGYSAFSDCTSLSKAEFRSVTGINAYAFSGCTALETVILGGTSVATLTNANAFGNTPIASGTGHIYVPDGLVNSYKAAAGWSTYSSRIKPISEYAE